MVATIQPLLVNGVNAAKFLAISRRKFAYLVAEGRIPVVKIDGATRYRLADLAEFAADNVQVRSQEEV